MDSQDLPLVMLAFLQADCTTNPEYGQELLHIEQEINKQDTDCNGPLENGGEGKGEVMRLRGGREDFLGQRLYAFAGFFSPPPLEQVATSVSPDPHGNLIDRDVVERLRDIAAQLEEGVVAQAAQDLRRRLEDGCSEEWGALLSQTVDSVMKHSASLRDLPQERVLLAVTLALVRGVCVKAPRLLQNLFHTALQYVRGSAAAQGDGAAGL